MTEPRDRINLSPGERRGLAQLAARSGRSARPRRRAYAILLLSIGLTGVEIARRTGYTGVHVSRLKARFLAGRLAGLADRPKSGRPPRVPLREATHVVALALRAAVKGTNRPPITDIARRTGISSHRVQEILAEHGLALPAGRRSRVAALRVDGIAAVHRRYPDAAFVFSCNSTRPEPADRALRDFAHVFAAVAGGLSLPGERRDDPPADVFRFLDTLAEDSGADLHAILGGRSLYPRPGAEECEARKPPRSAPFHPAWGQVGGVGGRLAQPPAEGDHAVAEVSSNPQLGPSARPLHESGGAATLHLDQR